MNKNLLIGILAAMLVLSSLVAATGNEQQQTKEQQLTAATEVPAESKAKEKGYYPRVWIKTEVGSTEQGAPSTEDLKAKLAKAESSIQELREKLAVAEGAVKEQSQQLTAATEALAESKVKEKGDYSRVWIKTEITSAEQEARRMEELQAKLAKTESSILELRKKLSLAEQGAQGTEELQAKLAKAESSIQKLREKLSFAEQGAQDAEELQGKLAKAETSIQKLRVNSAFAEQETQNTKELQAKLTKAESSIHDLEGKLEESALSIRDLRGKVAAAESAADQSRIAHEYESVSAQVIGLEKIVEEKNAILEKTGKERDHWKINKDLLLSRITEQQASLRQLQEENRGLLRDLAAKKNELAVVNEQLIQARVQQQ